MRIVTFYLFLYFSLAYFCVWTACGAYHLFLVSRVFLSLVPSYTTCYSVSSFPLILPPYFWIINHTGIGPRKLHGSLSLRSPFVKHFERKIWPVANNNYISPRWTSSRKDNQNTVCRTVRINNSSNYLLQLQSKNITSLNENLVTISEIIFKVHVCTLKYIFRSQKRKKKKN